MDESKHIIIPCAGHDVYRILFNVVHSFYNQLLKKKAENNQNTEKHKENIHNIIYFVNGDRMVASPPQWSGIFPESIAGMDWAGKGEAENKLLVSSKSTQFIN
jgi:hypothetical protein